MNTRQQINSRFEKNISENINEKADAILQRLNYDEEAPFNPTGEAFDYVKYNSGTWLAVCEDDECLCIHEVDQHTHQIEGYPASVICNSLRLNVLDLVDKAELKCDIKKNDIKKIDMFECIDILTKINNDSQIQI